MLRTLTLLAAVSGPVPGSIDTVRLTATVDRPGDREMIDIAGYYTCRGKEASGKQYTGIAVITKANEIYIVQWTIGVGSTFMGVGIRQGNTLAVSWAQGTEKGILRGINLYRIEKGPMLTGRWATLPGDGTLKTETLTFLKRLGDE
jgi:hypothetical protein